MQVGKQNSWKTVPALTGSDVSLNSILSVWQYTCSVAYSVEARRNLFFLEIISGYKFFSLLHSKKIRQKCHRKNIIFTILIKTGGVETITYKTVENIYKKIDHKSVIRFRNGSLKILVSFTFWHIYERRTL